jgi:hypothetical protein
MNPEFGAPPPVSAWAKLQPYLGGLITAGALAGVSLYALQIVMPAGYKPMEIMGDATASFENHELQGKMAMRLEYERRLADSVAQANAKTATDQLMVTAAIQQQADNLTGLSIAAKVADLACLGGKMIAANTQPAAPVVWGRQSQDIDWHSGAQNVANATCGVGNDLREGIQASLFDAGQTAAAKRGMSLTDGAVRQANTVQTFRTGPAVQDVAARPAIPHREWTADQRKQLQAYAERQSRATLIQFVEGIDTVHNGLTPEWYDRVAAYRFEHPEQ